MCVLWIRNKCNTIMAFCVIVLLLPLFRVTTALILQQCVSGWVTVPETAERVDNVLSCTGIPDTHTVYWQFKPATSSSSPINIGHCPPYPGPCTILVPNFSFHRTSNDVGHLSWVRGISRNLTGVLLYCYSETDRSNIVQCGVDITYPAENVHCSVQFNSAWTVSGRCEVPKIYSSQGSYSCTWYQSDGTFNELVSSNYVVLTTSQSTTDQNFMKAICTLNGHPMPAKSATYTYTVVISPGLGPVGTTFKGDNVVGVPSPPKNNCTTDYVSELSRLSCTCSSDNLGSPAGRLIWEGTSSAQLVVDIVTRNLTGRQYNCLLLWNPNAEAQTSVYTLKVAYGPLQPTFTWNSSKTEENQTLSFHCKAEGRPTPNITLIHQDSGAVLASQPSPLLWLVSRGQCKDGGVYNCRAGNAMGPDTQTNVTVIVTCQPREVELNSGVPNRPILNFKDAPLSYVFSMTAYPTPTSFSVTFIGVDMTFTSPERNVTGINFNVSCQQRSRPLYIASCTLTVDNVTSATAAGFYRLTLTNDEGSGDFVFQVKINATEGGSEAPDVNAGAIAGGVVAAVVVVVVVVVVFIVVITRRKQGTDGGGGEGGTEEYAVVNKGNKAPVFASAQPPDTYAVANKGKKTPQTGRTPENKAKTRMPDKQKNKNLKHPTAGNTDHEYSNMALSMLPPTNKADTISDDKHSKQTVGGGRRQTNKDGLTYTTMDFTGPAGQQSVQSEPPHAAQGVLYSEVVFNQATPSH